MGETTIEWTAHAVVRDKKDGAGSYTEIHAGYTFNPWIGCEKVSPGCKHCYAEAQSDRFWPGIWGRNNPRKFVKDDYWGQLETWNNKAKKIGVSLRVFVGSMCDIMEDRQDVKETRISLFNAVERYQFLDFLFLTKRPENYKKMLPSSWLMHPRPNVWLGTSIENQEYIDRAGALLSVPAWVHFVSAEPLLGRLDLSSVLCPTGVNWLIIGGESGPRARPMHSLWAIDLVEQADGAKIPVFFKQWGTWKPGSCKDMREGDLWVSSVGGTQKFDAFIPQKFKDGFEYIPMIRGSKTANGRDLIDGRNLAATPFSFREGERAVYTVEYKRYFAPQEVTDGR